jgi:hypothetical protein
VPAAQPPRGRGGQGRDDEEVVPQPRKVEDESDRNGGGSRDRNAGDRRNPLPLTQYPNVKTTSLNLKGVYKVDKNWSITAGYAYQKYDYNDDQFSGYVNTIPFPGVTTNTSQSYLNGWNAFQSYNANIFYLLGTFRY